LKSVRGEGKKDRREEKKNICVVGLGWVGLGLEKKGMGDGDGGLLEWVRVIAVNCKVFWFFGVVPSCCTFLKRGGVSFFSELLVSTGLSIGWCG